MSDLWLDLANVVGANGTVDVTKVAVDEPCMFLLCFFPTGCGGEAAYSGVVPGRGVG